MEFYKVALLSLNCAIVVLVAGQSELDKEIEIIPGKPVPQKHPLDAQYAGHYVNDIYGGSPVS